MAALEARLDTSLTGQGRLDLAAQLRQRYRLTLQEARVAVLVANGYRAKEIAATLGVSIFTIRAHLRAIFFRTGTRRQAALVRAVLTTTRTRRS